MARQPCSNEARAHIVMGGFLSCAVGVRLSEHERAGHFCPGCLDHVDAQNSPCEAVMERVGAAYPYNGV